MTMIEFPVRNRWTGKVQFTAKIEANETTAMGVKLGMAVKWAVESHADLTGADLTGANLYDADLTGANLDGVDLTGANLDGVDLYGANLYGANLTGANLYGANLTDANLYGANLTGANLYGANLYGANLYGETLRPFKADLWATLIGLRATGAEISHLIAKLRAGEVDGSTYNGVNHCGCLVATIGGARGVHGEALDHNASRPAERWFMMIRPGDKPENETGGGFAARMALEWTEELATALGMEIA